MFKRILPTAIAIGVGILTLLGILIPISPLKEVSIVLTQWAMVIGVFAFLLASLNLLRVHLSRIVHRSKNSIASVILLLSASASLVIVLTQKPEGNLSQQILTGLLIPGESTLMALTAVTLTLAGMRILRERRNVGSVLFIFVTILVLVGTVPYITILGTISNWIQNVLATGGMRSIVMGVALGTTITGLRVLFGTTRPHSDD